MRSVPETDLTGRARIRHAALRLFAQNGYDGTSVRAIAAAAGVSPALVTHHFGSKERLRAEVEDEVLDLIGGALTEVEPNQPAEQLMRSLGEASARWFGADPDVRGYLRQALLSDGAAGTVLYGRILEGARNVADRLDAAESLRSDADRDWVPFALLLFAIGPLMFEHLLPADAFADAVLAGRSAAFQRILLHGILREDS